MNLNKTVRKYSKNAVTRGDKRLEAGTGLPEVLPVPRSRWKRPLLSLHAATSTAPARARLELPRGFIFLQQWVYTTGFSINPVQPFAQAYFVYYST